MSASVRVTADVFADLRKALSVNDVIALLEMFRTGNDGPFVVTFNGRHIVGFSKIPPVKRPGDLAAPQVEEPAEIEPEDATALPSPDGGGRRGRAKR